MEERFIINLSAALMSSSTFLFLLKKAPLKTRMLQISTLIFTGALLLYYNFFIIDPSHGIGIILLPLITVWIVWRQETAGKPTMSPDIMVILQLVFCFTYIALVWLQEN